MTVKRAHQTTLMRPTAPCLHSSAHTPLLTAVQHHRAQQSPQPHQLSLLARTAAGSHICWTRTAAATPLSTARQHNRQTSSMQTLNMQECCCCCCCLVIQLPLAPLPCRICPCRAQLQAVPGKWRPINWDKECSQARGASCRGPASDSTPQTVSQ